ncbi:MAG TPA: YIP1 family protein [Myxococcota bacterium]|jgi:hypothetical protein|nr:YIP1 family protein [Myxococcota bacterium]
MADLVQRAIAAARLDPQVYEEVEADQTALGQAMTVVVVAALASGIGSLGSGGMANVIGTAIGALIGWYVWAFVIWAVGTKVLPTPQTHADVGQVLRTTGFSAAPGVLAVTGIVPGVGPYLMVAASIWQLVAMIVAVRQALDYESTGRAIAVCVIGYVAMIIVIFAIVLLIGGFVGGFGHGGPAPAMGAFASPGTLPG